MPRIYRHDLAYAGTADRNAADRKMIKELDNISNPTQRTHGKSHRETDLEDEIKLRNLTASRRNKRLCNCRTQVIYALNVMTNTYLPRISNCSSSASTSVTSHDVLVQVLVKL